MCPNPELVNPMVPMPSLPDGYASMAAKAEQDALGLLMLWNDKQAVRDYEPSLFTSKAHLAIFLAIEAAAAHQEIIDVVSVSVELEQSGQLAEAGGLAYIAAIAKDAPQLRTWQLLPVLRGFALMRYAMAPKEGIKVIVRLRDAIEHGWLHGKAWLASGAQILARGGMCLCQLAADEHEWVCYAYLDDSGGA